jgi:hypothetical protein
MGTYTPRRRRERYRGTRTIAAGSGRKIGALWLAVVIALSVLSLGGFSGVAAAGNHATTHASCTTISTSGAHALSESVTSSDGSDCIEVTASDVVLDGNGYTVDAGSGGYGVALSGSTTNVTVRNLTAVGGDQGVHVGDDAAAATVANVTVRDVGGRGIVLTGPDATVTDTRVENPGTRGFLTAGNGDGAVISDTVVVGGGGGQAGLRVQTDATLRNVTVRDASGHGISVVVDPTVDILGSTVTGAGGQGIAAESGIVTVANTTVNGSSEEGIRIAGGVTIAEIRDSVVVENEGYDGGVSVADRYVEISNLTSARNDDMGLRLEAKGTTVRNSTFRNNGVHGVYAFDATETTLADNAITGNDAAGIEVSGDSDVSLDGDRFDANGDEPIYASDGGVSATDVDLSGTTYSFDVYDVAVEPAASTPPLPRGQVGLGGALNVTVLSYGESFDGAIPYDESVATAESGEGAVTLWRYDADAGWSTVYSTVDEANDVVSFSTTEFSTFVPLVAADGPGEEVVGCRVLDSSGRYTLAAPISNGSTDACIEVTASDVVVDGNGYSVTGVDRDGSVGFDVADGVSNVTVRNVTFADWPTDVSTLGASGVVGENITLSRGTVVDFEAKDVQIADVDADAAPEIPSGQLALGRYLDVSAGLGGAELDLTVDYDPPAGSTFDETNVSIWALDEDGDWVDVGGTVDTSANTVSATLPYFSRVAPLATSNLDGEAVTSCRVIDEPGVYSLPTDLTSTDDSACIEIDASDVVLSGNGYTIDGGSGGEGVLVESGTTISNVTVRDLTVTGGGDGLVLDDATNVTLAEVTARDVGGEGIHLHPGATNATLTGVTVNGTGDSAQGIYVEAANATVEDARSDDASFDGYSIRAANATLVDSTTDGVGAQGVYVSGEGTDAEIRNVTVTDADDNAVRIAGVGASVTDVFVRNPSSDGIQVQSGGTNATVRNNTVSAALGAGFDVHGVNATVRNNTVVAVLGVGFDVHGGNSTFRNNTVTSASGDGFDVSGDDVALRNNTIRSVDGHGLHVRPGAVGVTLRGDTFVDDTFTTFLVESRVSATAITLNGTTVSLTARDVELSPVADLVNTPDGFVDLDAFFRAAAQSEDAYADLTLSYARPGPDVVESKTAVWTLDLGDGWSGPVPSTLDAANDTVSVNLTDFSTVAALAPKDIPGEEVLDCRVIDSPGTYSLAIDLENRTADPCIDVQSDDVVFDGQGESIRGGPGTTGVRVGTGGDGAYENVTVRNVTVTGHGGEALALFDGPTTLENVSVGTATLSGTGRDVAVNGTTLASLPAETVDLGPNLTVGALGSDATLDATVPFELAPYLDPSGVAVWHDAGGWSTGAGTVDTANRTASVSATPTGSETTYAVLADAPSGTIVSDCRVIDEPGTYLLGGDVRTTDERCIEIESSDVHLRGYGYEVVNRGVSSGAGILVDGTTKSYENVTVRNLDVGGWQPGVRYRGVSDGTIADVNVSYSGESGIAVESSSNTTVRNATVRTYQRDGTGVTVRGGSDVRVTESLLTDNADSGVEIRGDVTAVTVRDNTISDNGIGVRLVESDAGSPRDTTLQSNVLSGNDEGFALNAGTGTTSTDDTITGSTAVAVRVSEGTKLAATRVALGPGPSDTRTIGFDARNVELVVEDSPPPTGPELSRVGHALYVGAIPGDSFLDLAVPYTAGDVAGILNGTLAVRRYDDGWTPVTSSTLNESARVVSANLTSPGTVGVFGSPPDPALFDPVVDGTSDPVTGGDPLGVTVTVTNTGDLAGNRAVALSADGETVDSRDLALNADESQTITLTWATDSDDAGAYNLTVASGNASATVDVRVYPPDTSSDTSDSGSDSTPEPTPTPGSTQTATTTPTEASTGASTATVTPPPTPTETETGTATAVAAGTADATGTEPTVPTATVTSTPPASDLRTTAADAEENADVGAVTTADGDGGFGPISGPEPVFVVVLFAAAVLAGGGLWYRSEN